MFLALTRRGEGRQRCGDEAEPLSVQLEASRRKEGGRERGARDLSLCPIAAAVLHGDLLRAVCAPCTCGGYVRAACHLTLRIAVSFFALGCVAATTDLIGPRRFGSVGNVMRLLC